MARAPQSVVAACSTGRALSSPNRVLASPRVAHWSRRSRVTSKSAVRACRETCQPPAPMLTLGGCRCGCDCCAAVTTKLVVTLKLQGVTLAEFQKTSVREAFIKSAAKAMGVDPSTVCACLCSCILHCPRNTAHGCVLQVIILRVVAAARLRALRGRMLASGVDVQVGLTQSVSTVRA